MTVTVASLVAAYAEFADTPTQRVQTAIDDATAQFTASQFGDLYDKVITLAACHDLAMSQFGEPNRLVPGEGTVYGKKLDDLIRARWGGPYTIGQTTE